MALLQNEDFAIWYLRTSYLASDKDGVGERLVSVDSSILNTPGFRAAGWNVDHIPRTYSPPIPTTVTPEYVKQSKDRRDDKGQQEGDEGGLVTGRLSNDTIGPAPQVVRRRRKKEQAEEDDSSELSDESDDDLDGTQRAAQQIKFAKMPSRNRSESSPIRHLRKKNSLENGTMSPSKPEIERRPRTSSVGAVQAVKARARADTVTSSEVSSDNEIDPNYFRRRHLDAVHKVKSNSTTDLDDRTVPEEDEDGEHRDGKHPDDSDLESGSDLSSDLGETVDSTSILGDLDNSAHQTSSPMFGVIGTPDLRAATRSESPRKPRSIPPLQTLPTSRPISKIAPISLLSQAIDAQNKGPENPTQVFATLSGKGSATPLWIKIYAPFSTEAEEPFEMPLLRTSKEGNPVIVAEAIGLALWRYAEEGREPKIPHSKLGVNNWTLRMVEDGEVDFDFPALDRKNVITNFTSNNNRGARGRSRERPFDEFALVEATPQQVEANDRNTPQFIHKPEPEVKPLELGPAMPPPTQPIRAAPAKANVLLAGQPFASALSNAALTPADMPAPANRQATPRMGTTKTIRVRYIDLDITARSITIEISTDSYIAEILDHVCKRWNLDKAAFFLRVAGTSTVAPVDRTVEVLGARSDLDLVRRRFGAGPAASTGSFQSASPTAPLLLDIQGPTKSKKGHQTLQALAQKQDLASTASNFKKYYVNRKQLKAFAQGSSQRVLIFDGDFLLIMPADAGKNHLFDSNVKSTSVAFADIMRCKVSSKHSKLVRVTVKRPTEPKRYDFEARTAGEAQEIVDDILREMKLAKS